MVFIATIYGYNKFRSLKVVSQCKRKSADRQQLLSISFTSHVIEAKFEVRNGAASDWHRGTVGKPRNVDVIKEKYNEAFENNQTYVFRHRFNYEKSVLCIPRSITKFVCSYYTQSSFYQFITHSFCASAPNKTILIY
jgi:hypothetical protein